VGAFLDLGLQAQPSGSTPALNEQAVLSYSRKRLAKKRNGQVLEREGAAIRGHYVSPGDGGGRLGAEVVQSYLSRR
jgi:hypothetical protein